MAAMPNAHQKLWAKAAAGAAPPPGRYGHGVVQEDLQHDREDGGAQGGADADHDRGRGGGPRNRGLRQVPVGAGHHQRGDHTVAEPHDERRPGQQRPRGLRLDLGEQRQAGEHPEDAGDARGARAEPGGDAADEYCRDGCARAGRGDQQARVEGVAAAHDLHIQRHQDQRAGHRDRVAEEDAHRGCEGPVGEQAQVDQRAVGPSEGVAAANAASRTTPATRPISTRGSPGAPRSLAWAGA
jgi:hypothetical protein